MDACELYARRLTPNLHSHHSTDTLSSAVTATATATATATTNRRITQTEQLPSISPFPPVCFPILFYLDKKAATMSFCGTLIPQEILTDILSRLPVKSLCRFKCVSPSWNSLIANPYFANTHLNRTNTQNPKYLDDQRNIVISSSLNLYSIDIGDVIPTATKLDFPTVEQHAANKRVKVWSSCDGLLLVSYSDNSNFLLNPSTRECKKLHAPPFVLNPVDTFWCGYGLGFNSSTEDYNIVRLSPQSKISIVDVYSLKNNAWRRIQHIDYVVVGTFRGGVFLNGCLHWLCFCLRNRSYVIGAFNLSDQIFREVPTPAFRLGWMALYFRVEVVGGCLRLVESRASYTTSQVWKMEEYGVGESWTKLTIDVPTETPSLCFMCLLAEDKLLFDDNGRGQGKKLVVYDSKKETLRDMVVAGIPSEFTFGCAYVESLVSPILGRGIAGQ